MAAPAALPGIPAADPRAAMIPPHYTKTALARGPSGWQPRHLDQRRMLYRPKWDAVTIPAGQVGEIQFFTNKSGNRWVTNSDQAGMVSVYESFLVSRILLSPGYGTSEADLIELLNNAVFEFHIQNDRAYELLMLYAQPGAGLDNGSIANHGAPITGYAQDLGNVVVGGGISYRGVIKFPNGALKTARSILLRAQLEAMADIVVG